jgi:hypothetical protein
MSSEPHHEGVLCGHPPKPMGLNGLVGRSTCQPFAGEASTTITATTERANTMTSTPSLNRAPACQQSRRLA